MNWKISVIILLIFFTSFNKVYSQPWLYKSSKLKSTSSQPSFRESQAAFYNYFKDKKIKGAKGQKQFKRWEYFMQPRLHNASTINSKELWLTINAVPGASPTDSADWKFVGPTTTPHWVETSLKTGNGRLNCIAFHPSNKDILYVGAPSGGVWKSTDAGLNWTTTTDKLDAIGISDIVISHENPSTLYLATGDGDHGDTYAIGILKSVNGGTTWETTGLSLDVSQGIYFRKMIMHPSSADTMLACSNIGIHKTTDGWVTSSLVQAGSFRDLEFKPQVPDIVYATSFDHNGNAKIYKSTNGGDSFQITQAGLTLNNDANRIELAVSPANNNYVYALISKASNNGLHSFYRSTNSGDSWILVFDDSSENLLGWQSNGTDSKGQGDYDLSLAVSPTNINLILAGGINIWKSTNGGSSWSISSFWYRIPNIDYVHADQHMIAYSPLTDYVFALNDGGVYRSLNDGNDWVDISNNLQILQSYKISVSQLSEGKLVTGNQDNGSFLYSNSDWFQILGGDGMNCHIDPNNDDIIYGSLYYGELYKSVDGGVNFTRIISSDTISGAWVTPFILHPVNSSILYAGFKDVYKSVNRGNSWEKISANLSTSTLDALAVAASNDSYIYASAGSTLHRTTDGGVTWNVISAGLPDLYITSICISPNDQNEIWVSLSGYNNNQKVYYSVDGGDNWSNYSTGLPNIPTNEIIIRPNSNKELYLATDIGVYKRHADTNSWLSFSNNLPNVIVSDLEIATKFNKLRAGTYGRGVWESKLEKSTPPIASFTAYPIKVCLNAPITLVYDGKLGFDSLSWNVGDATIVWESGDFDTLQIQFNSIGKKTIQLNHYKNDTLTKEFKYNYIDVNSAISVDIAPSNFFVCDTSKLQIALPNGYSYSIDPSKEIIELRDTLLILQPKNDIIYTVTIDHGVCQTTEKLNVTFMPNMACDALLIPQGVNGYFSNECATKENNEPVPGVGTLGNGGCVAQDGWCSGEDVVRKSLWFKALVPDNGHIFVNTIGIDTKIALYEVNNCSDLFDNSYKLLAANDDKSEGIGYSQISLISGLTPGDTLYLQVDGSFGGETGEFLVEIRDNNSSTGHIEKETISNIKVFPNPADEKFTVKLIVPGRSTVDIDLIAENGTVVLSRPGVEEVGFYEQEFDSSHLHGLYILKIRTKNNVLFKKIIIQ